MGTFVGLLFGLPLFLLGRQMRIYAEIGLNPNREIEADIPEIFMVTGVFCAALGIGSDIYSYFL